MRENPNGLSDEEFAIQEMGVGKNMVRAIRFWIQVMGVVDQNYVVAPLGEDIFSPEDGFDPYLEDIRTLWLLHWKISTAEDPLFAWDYMLSRWQRPEFFRSEIVPVFMKEAADTGRNYSQITLKQHFDVFLHTYVPTRNSKGTYGEDNLDCPLVDLELIQQVAERSIPGSKRVEPVYAFRRERKVGITPELFLYCLNDYWERYWSQEKTLTFRQVAVAHNSLGQVFKLPEQDLRERLESIEADSGGLFRYEESASLAQVKRVRNPEQDLLAAIYESEHLYV